MPITERPPAPPQLKMEVIVDQVDDDTFTVTLKHDARCSYTRSVDPRLMRAGRQHIGTLPSSRWRGWTLTRTVYEGDEPWDGDLRHPATAVATFRRAG